MDYINDTELKFKLSEMPQSVENPIIIKYHYLKCENQKIKDKIICLFDNKQVDWNKVNEFIVMAKITKNTRKFYIKLDNENNIYKNKINENKYLELSKMPYYGMIIFLRYKIPILGTSMFINVNNYIGNLMGLIIAEIKYDPNKYTKSQIIEFAEKYLGTNIMNVTSNEKYSYKKLGILNNIIQNKS